MSVDSCGKIVAEIEENSCDTPMDVNDNTTILDNTANAHDCEIIEDTLNNLVINDENQAPSSQSLTKVKTSSRKIASRNQSK